MAQASIERRFHGTACLVVLLLRRLAKSNDIDEGLAAARALGMIDEWKEAFVRRCLAIDDELQAGRADSASITHELADQLQAIAFSINSADPA